MVVLTNAAFLILVGLVVWVLGYLTDYKAVGMVGAILVLGVGIMMLSGGLEYKVGETETQISTNETVVENVYQETTMPTNLSAGFLVSVLGGLFVLHAFNDIGPK